MWCANGMTNASFNFVFYILVFWFYMLKDIQAREGRSGRMTRNSMLRSKKA